MTRLRWLLLALLILAFVAGWGIYWWWQCTTLPATALAALEKAENFELISLEPSDQTSEGERFQGNLVLGRTTIHDVAVQQRLIEALKKGAAEGPWIGDKCFNPRHNIRVYGDGKMVDLLICFECKQGEIFLNGGRVSGFQLSDSPQPVFDKVLQDAGIPLAKPRH